ncbi:MAG TPA: ATP-binding protein [Planctomycetia bacterium]|nr:ATP-binding protein [Planctomycetia bacterium]
MAWLTVIHGPDRGRRIEIGAASAVIGRDAKASIRLHDHEISRSHAELKPENAGAKIVDLGSSNGTFVNGEKILAHVLRRGDRIRMGGTELLFTVGSGEANERDLAGKIDMVGRQQESDASAILRSIKSSEGSQFLLYPERTGSVWLQTALANLAVMYETSQAIGRIGDIGELLDHIMSLVFRSIRADRGCVMLSDPETGQLKPTAVRYAPGVDSEERITISRSIVDWTIKKEEGAIVLNAQKDQRFADSPSVSQLGIREAMCVPLRGRHETLGAMYVDIKTDRREVLSTGAPAMFNEDQLKLMLAIAAQAGLAIEDNRFHRAMVQAERLAAMGQTIATVSHHIKNVLQGVRSGNDVVEMGLKEDNFDLVRSGWNLVRKNQDRIYSMVMDMLTVSKDRQPDLQPLDLNRIAKEVFQLMEARAQAQGVELLIRLDKRMPTILADAEQIHRAALNLVSNAIDALEDREGGKVLIETRHDRAKGNAELIVGDNGPGIPPEMHERIFQVFVSTKGSRGTGLGLPVTRKILREHDGDVRLVSAVEKGSMFVLQLPLREGLADMLLTKSNPSIE